MTTDQDTTIRKDTVDARQGSSRPRLIYVLGASLVLVIVAFAIVWMSSR